MSSGFVRFDDVRELVVDAVGRSGPLPDEIGPVYLVRNLYGKVGISAPEDAEGDASVRQALERLAGRLRETLGAHGAPAGEPVLFVGRDLLDDLQAAAWEVPGASRVHFVDRLVTASGWWTVGGSDADSAGGGPPSVGTPARWTLYSVKGGVGRSTTAAVLAWELARTGRRVLVADIDLESPGLSAMLEPDRRPEFGVADWFVEDLVGQGERVFEHMTAAPRWTQDFDGDVRVVPAHGADAGEYLAKLGRVHVDTDVAWTARLRRLLERLESRFEPEVVLLESRSGLHDAAAATVTDLDAQVLLFAADSESHWTDYGLLFRHWQRHGLAARIRERLSIVSALTPELDAERYLQRFRERAWDLFRDRLYDDLSSPDDAGDTFSFDLGDDDAPHAPFPIHWSRGLAAGASLRDLEESTVRQAYRPFLTRFDRLMPGGGGGETP